LRRGPYYLYKLKYFQKFEIMKDNKDCSTSRRDFIRTSGAVAAGFMILPSNVISGLGHTAPSDKLNIAGIGVGGMGRENLRKLNSENIVALCDVDWKYAKRCFDDYPKAKRFYDWRVMLDEMKDSIDAVVVATSDHTHGIVAAHAMTLGMHAYVQKPLTLTVYESRLLTKLARKHKVVTQMGNQGNSGEGLRQICEWIWDGAIGKIEEVHAWTNRPVWPQGIERPQEIMSIPNTLNWDLFLGPAPERPYHAIYTPWNFRGWWDFGTGALGDMACHILDPVFKGLKLGYPSKVQGTSTPINSETAPIAEMVQYTFPKRDNKMPEVKVTWWDGGFLPPRPEELPDSIEMGRDGGGGCLFIGSKGKLMCGCYARNPFLLPESLDQSYRRPKPILRRVSTSHEMDWARACKDGYDNSIAKDTMPSSNFDYAGPMNEMVAMGVVAVRLQGLKRELHWDGANMRFTNISDNDTLKIVTSDHFEVIDGDPKFMTEYTDPFNAKEFAANLVNKPYRKGWSLPPMPTGV
jgi:predicted dehydrogenase